MPKRAIDTGLPKTNAPIEWATVADGVLYTVHVAMRQDGTIDTGDIRTQTELTLSNLKRSVEAAGGTMADVTQVTVYLPDADDFAGMNQVYQSFFSEPFPNRATIVAGLTAKGARIEVVAYAHLPR